MNESPIQPTPEEQLPEPISAALRSRYGPTQAIPPGVDESIRRNARKHLQAAIRVVEHGSHEQSTRERWKWVAGSVGSLLTLVLLVLVWPRSPARSTHMESMSAVSDRSMPQPAMLGELEQVATAHGDLDRNGRVDILDAFALARTIQSGATPSADADLNHDGQLNQLDVDLIALNAVTIL